MKRSSDRGMADKEREAYNTEYAEHYREACITMRDVNTLKELKTTLKDLLQSFAVPRGNKRPTKASLAVMHSQASGLLREHGVTFDAEDSAMNLARILFGHAGTVIKDPNYNTDSGAYVWRQTCGRIIDLNVSKRLKQPKFKSMPREELDAKVRTAVFQALTPSR